MKYFQIGKHVIPLWLLGVGLAGLCLLAFASYMLLTVTIPFEVREPLDILHYPSKLSLYPGETEYFNVTVQNYASRKYNVFLDFSLDNATYEDNYVSFSNETYVVHSGIQNLTAWLRVSADAPSIDATLRVDLYREATEFTEFPTEQLSFINTQWDTTGTIEWFVFTVKNTGSADLSIQEVRVDGVKATLSSKGANSTLTSPLPMPKGSIATFNVTKTFSSGIEYDFTVMTTTGMCLRYLSTAP